MAVEITAVQLAAALRIGDGATALAEPQASVINRMLAVATATVERYAEDAPSDVQDEAVIRMAGYMFDAPPGNSRQHSNAFSQSGAQALVAPWRVVRATKIEPDDED